MSGVFTLRGPWNSDKTPEELGVSVAFVSWNFAQAEVLTLEQVVQTHATPCILAYDDAITLKRDGVSIFKGRVSEVLPSLEAGDVKWTMQIKNAWRMLERTIFTQSWPGDDNSPRVILGAIPESNGSYLLSPTADLTDGSTWDTWNIVKSILQYAIARGVNMQIGSGFTGLFALSTAVDSASCAACLRSVLQWHPRVVAAWDYATEPPTLNFYQQGDTNPANEVPQVTLPSDGRTGVNVITNNIKPRPDMQVSGVVLRYVNTSQAREDDYIVKTDKAPNDAVTGLEPSAFLAEIAFNDANWFTPATTKAQLLAQAGAYTPTGLAAWLYAQLGPLFWDGSYTITEAIPGSTGLLLGKALNLSGDIADQATMKALIQSQTLDCKMGTMTLTVGPPAQLGLSDWLSFYQLACAKRTNVTTQTARDNTNPADEVPSGSLLLTKTKPKWDKGPVLSGTAVWVTPGTAGTGGSAVPPSNNLSTFPLAANTHFFIKVTLPAANDFEATGSQIVTGASDTAFKTAAYTEDGDRPTAYFVYRGFVDENGNVINVSQGGNILVEELLKDITKDDGQTTVTIRRLTHNVVP